MPVEHTKEERGLMDKVIRPDGKWDWPQFFREINNILNGLILAVRNPEEFQMWKYKNGFFEESKKPEATSIFSEPYERPLPEPDDDVPHMIEEASQEARSEFNRAADQPVPHMEEEPQPVPQPASAPAPAP